MRKKSKAQKRSWARPMLTILTMGKPEEAVLDLCKAGIAHAYDGPLYKWSACKKKRLLATAL